MDVGVIEGLIVGVGVGLGVAVGTGDQFAIAVLGPSIAIMFEVEELPEAPPLHPLNVY